MEARKDQDSIEHKLVSIWRT